MLSVLVRVSFAVKKHHDHLIGPGLQIQRFSPSSSWQEAKHVQAGVVLGELRLLHLVVSLENCLFQAARKRV